MKIEIPAIAAATTDRKPERSESRFGDASGSFAAVLGSVRSGSEASRSLETRPAQPYEAAVGEGTGRTAVRGHDAPGPASGGNSGDGTRSGGTRGISARPESGAEKSERSSREKSDAAGRVPLFTPPTDSGPAEPEGGVSARAERASGAPFETARESGSNLETEPAGPAAGIATEASNPAGTVAETRPGSAAKTASTFETPAGIPQAGNRAGAGSEAGVRADSEARAGGAPVKSAFAQPQQKIQDTGRFPDIRPPEGRTDSAGNGRPAGRSGWNDGAPPGRTVSRGFDFPAGPIAGRGTAAGTSPEPPARAEDCALDPSGRACACGPKAGAARIAEKTDAQSGVPAPKQAGAERDAAREAETVPKRGAGIPRPEKHPFYQGRPAVHAPVSSGRPAGETVQSAARNEGAGRHILLEIPEPVLRQAQIERSGSGPASGHRTGADPQPAKEADASAGGTGSAAATAETAEPSVTQGNVRSDFMPRGAEAGAAFDVPVRPPRHEATAGAGPAPGGEVRLPGPARPGGVPASAPNGPAPELHDPDFLRWFAGRIESQVKAGRDVIRIQLKPEHLGRVEVRVEATAAGMQARIIAESSGARAFLEHGLASLHHLFQQQGLKVDRIDVGLFEGGWAANPDGGQASRHSWTGRDRHAAGRGIRGGGRVALEGGDLPAGRSFYPSIHPHGGFHAVA